MGLLADIFSTADTAKRRLSGLLSDPMGTLALGVTRFGEDQGGLLNMTQNAYPMAGNKTVLNSPQQIANFRQQVADKGAEMAMQAATVWHGSPHKFDKFDSSKIGTGEGGAVYGEGVNLSAAPKVAQDYARDQRGMAAKTMADKMLTNWGDRQKAIEAMQGRLQKAEQELIPEAVQPYRDALQMLQSGDHAGGGLYKVDLPDSAIAKMIAWDKPISEQSAEVISALGKAGINTQSTAKAGPMARGQERYLSKFGVTGVQYPYGDTTNYVVFPGNEGLLQILERNGQALK